VQKPNFTICSLYNELAYAEAEEANSRSATNDSPIYGDHMNTLLTNQEVSLDRLDAMVVAIRLLMAADDEKNDRINLLEAY
jgi:hypothetical protein